MTSSTLSTPNRRGFLKLSLTVAAIGGAGIGSWVLYEWPASELMTGFKILRKADLPFLQAITPVLLAGSFGAQKLITKEQVQDFLQDLDYKLTNLSPNKQGLLFQLLDAMAVTVARTAVTGMWRSWNAASEEDLIIALSRLEHHPVPLLRMGHSSMCQLFALTRYSSPSSWAHCGYPGPPKLQG
ncbi:twin-arginine translocation pathway signal protein [Pseudomonas sp. F1_0610]|uniref:twin-arginine translocation pathway signal protein n=1 Tax=Pseudomonas sp. F1_0610 TaxID=3114284 RepID=UPI0039C285F5